MKSSGALPPRAHPSWSSGLLRVGRALQVLLGLAAAAIVVLMILPFARNAARLAPARLPSTMVEVDWHDPQSSLYCVACHRQVAPAIGTLDVQRGHSQNVPLDETQVRAVIEMGTVAGPGNTLICMSCHRLGADGKYMLADTLDDSRLCQRCHTGHYARGTPHDLRESAPQEHNRFGLTAAEGGPCSACHMAHAHAREIISSPLDPDGYCITCHQEHGVARRHARTGASMQHPETHCLRCHDAHDAAHRNFLSEPPADLCIRCHADYGDAANGMHPVGEVRDPIPDAIVAAGGAAGDSGRSLSCATCHSIHAPANGRLLVMGIDNNELCLTCHRDALSARSGHGDIPRHGQMPPLAAEQVELVQSWGRPTGANGELLCVSCHRVHGALSTRNLLAFEPRYSDACIGCHPAQAALAGTTHDLRTRFPDVKNDLGVSALEGGACSACHGAHGPARAAAPSAADPRGTCVNCHQIGGLAAARAFDGTAHPQTDCARCHDPHTRAQPSYLVRDELTLCSECHANEARVGGGPHDRRRTAASPRWSGAARDGACLPCHVPHGGDRADLFRVGTGGEHGYHDDVCLVCHADAGWKADSAVAALHPHDIRPEQHKVALALVPKDDAGNLRMGCRTCHDPHGGAEPAHLARVGPNEPTASLCLHCHESKRYIEQTGHASDRLARAGFSVDSCKPCHAMHARPDDRWGQMLSPRFMISDTPVATAEFDGPVPCMSCHHENGPAPVREFASHPQRAMTNLTPPDAPGYLPLFNRDGHEDPQGQVTCRTCHVSHGRLDLLEMSARNEELTPAERRAMLMQLRPFIPPNVCTTCHGDDARAKFLFFHKPQQHGERTPDAGRR